MAVTWKKIAYSDQKLDDFGTPDDNTDLNATNARHGLLLKLIDDTTKFLRSDGSWQVPAGGGGGATVACKTSDETVNNSTTLQDDDDLKVSVGANEYWMIDLTMIMYQGNAFASLDFAFTIPAGGAIYELDTFASPTALDDATAEKEVTLANNSTRYYQTRLLYIGGANAGDVQLQWAQHTAQAVDTKMQAGSNLIAHQVE